MISFAYYWKRELVRLADRLDKRKSQKRWSFASTTALEKDVFLGAFSVRKLLDSEKISPSIADKPVELVFYPTRNEDGPFKHFTHRYATTDGKIVKISMRRLMDQFVHSYYFSPFVPAGKGMVGIFFSSDTKRKEGLYYITIGNLSDIFRRVGSKILSDQEIDRLLDGRSMWGGNE